MTEEYGRAALIAGIIDKMVNNADAKLFHAKKLMQTGEYEQAAGLLSFIAVNNPTLADVHYLLGIAQFGSGKAELAEASIKKAIELDPENQAYKDELETLEKARAGELPVQVEAAAKAAANAAAADDTSQ
jgi:Flp pilus assembly protein TadD